MSMGKIELTPRQRQVLKFIFDTIRSLGRPPTLREIGSRFGIAYGGGVKVHLAALERKGYLKLTGAHRGIELLQKKVWDLFGIPLIGRIAAGRPIFAQENYEGTLSPDDIYPRGDGIFALRVQGDSMRDAGILNGDWVFVRHQEDADPGQIVVALKDDEVTLKRLIQERGKRYLEPANPAYQREPLDGWRIEGIVIEVVRVLRH